jgi:hypothetical protein
MELILSNVRSISDESNGRDQRALTRRNKDRVAPEWTDRLDAKSTNRTAESKSVFWVKVPTGTARTPRKLEAQ